MTIPKEGMADPMEKFQEFSLWEFPGFYQTPKTAWLLLSHGERGQEGEFWGWSCGPLQWQGTNCAFPRLGKMEHLGRSRAGTLLSMEFAQVLMESSYGFFQAQINKKLTGLLWARAATSKQPGDLPNCLKSQRGTAAPIYMYGSVGIYTHIHYAE